MSTKQTPLMVQYHAIKHEYPAALVFFQVGDFYELFHDDAKIAAQFLGITLTKRGKDQGNDIPLCGVPVHTVKHYLGKLVKGGFSVVICDQLEAPTPGSLVKRGVTQVLTPGTLTDAALMDEKSASYIFTFVPEKDRWALVFAELLTAQLYATSCNAGDYKVLETELARFFPDEIIVGNVYGSDPAVTALKKQGYFTSVVHSEADTVALVDSQVQQKLDTITTAKAQLQTALDTFYQYMQKHHPASVATFTNIHMYEPDDFLVLDQATQRNLELVTNTYDGSRNHSLLAVLDKTTTGTGARTLKKWLVRPLVDRGMIDHRLDAVEYLKNQYVLLCDIQKMLQSIGDIERVVGRIALERATFFDYAHLAKVCCVLPELQMLLSKKSILLLTYVYDACAGFDDLQALLHSALNDDTTRDWVIKSGYNHDLDSMRYLMLNSQQALLDLEQEEQQKTGITSLKIRYNNLYGYYIEVTNANTHLVPNRYTQRHSLVGKNRYMSQELQILQERITTAQRDAQQKEQELFKEVTLEVRRFISRLRKFSTMIGHLDALTAFAQCASASGYVRPTFVTDSQSIIIDQGRHPVVEQLVGTAFVANNTTLTDQERLWIITGPNMGGKSTYLRQVALMSIMAQCGSFVPAMSATLPLLDRIFTRIGAGDNLASGKSTFLVEMEETADICRYATDKSLVILDEVGRGTSTQDGVALAQAIVEYLYTTVKARCLFATHYHELTHLADVHTGIVAYHTASKQTEQGIVFLHRVVPGVSHKSFGLEVAKLAHLPATVITRAQALVAQSGVVEHAGSSDDAQLYEKIMTLQEQVTLLQQQVAVFKTLQEQDVMELTPKKAFDLLWDLKNKI